MFASDASQAASRGYHVTSQAWEGTALTVTYQRDPAAAPQPATAAPSAPAAAPREGLQLPPAGIAIGGLLVIGGSFLPWATMGIFSANGMQGGDGIITAVVGVVLLLLGAAGAMDSARASGSWGASLVLGLVALALGGWHIADISGRVVTDVGSPLLGLHPDAGIGLYAIAIGGAVAAIGGWMTRVPGSAVGEAPFSDRNQS